MEGSGRTLPSRCLRRVVMFSREIVTLRRWLGTGFRKWAGAPPPTSGSDCESGAVNKGERIFSRSEQTVLPDAAQRSILSFIMTVCYKLIING